MCVRLGRAGLYGVVVQNGGSANLDGNQLTLNKHAVSPLTLSLSLGLCHWTTKGRFSLTLSGLSP